MKTAARVARIEFRILGPLQVVAGGRELALEGRKQRALLALLLLRANSVVSRDTLIDGLWGDEPPATASAALQVYLSRVRKLLATADEPPALERGHHGYCLRVEPGQLDSERFEALADAGRGALDAGDPLPARAMLREALALWRGPALADLADEPFAQAEVRRLEEQRAHAVEDAIDSELALGRARDVIPELNALIADHPYRERPRAQLMLALYRSGRQADALEAYQEARRALAELGLEPGDALRRAERQILEQDPELLRHAEHARPRREPLQRKRRRVGLVAAAAAAIFLVTALLLALVAVDGNEAGTPVSENSVAAIDPRSNKVVRAVALGAEPDEIAAIADDLWVAVPAERTLVRVDLRARRAVRRVGLAQAPLGLVVADGQLLVFDRHSIGRVDMSSGTVTVLLVESRSSPPFGDIAVGENAAWVGYGAWEGLTRFSLSSGRLEAQLRRVVPGHIEGSAPVRVALARDTLWLTHAFNEGIALRRVGFLAAVDVRTNRPLGAVRLPTVPSGIAVEGRDVWVALKDSDELRRIDSETRVVRDSIAVGDGPTAVLVAFDHVWVAHELDGTVWKLDARSGRVVARIRVGHRPRALTAGADRLWLSVGG